MSNSEKRNAQWKVVNDSELAMVCGYISSDRYLASIYGVPEQHVRRIRKKTEMKKATEDRRVNSAEKQKPPVFASDNYERTSKDNAVRGSQDLLAAIKRCHPERVQFHLAKLAGRI